MKKFYFRWLMVLSVFVGMSLSSYADNCTQTFTASGQDDDPTVVTVLPADITCTGGGTITSLTLNNSAGNLANTYCGSWYDFDLIIDGTPVITGGCKVDFDGTVISLPFTSIVVQSNDLDAYSDGITITFDLDVVYDPPACPAPTSPFTDAILATSANLNWTAGASETLWDVEWGTAGFTPAGAPSTGFDDVATATVNLGGLSDDTNYEWYVRADCGGDNTDVSAWIGPQSFKTTCLPFTTFPFFEGFNSASTSQACWTVLDENGDGDEWDMNYTTNPYEGDQVAIFYSDYNAGANDDYLISPPITLTGNERLKFWQRVQSAGEPNDFEVLLSITGTAAADFTTTILPDTACDNIAYQEFIIDLDAYTGTVYIAWHIPSGGLDGWRLYIDAVTVEEIPACTEPTDLFADNITTTTADLNWTDGNSTPAVGFNIEYGLAGFTPTGVATTTATVSPKSISGLLSGTSYDFYVQADCGTDETSPWVGPETFTTECAAFPVPLSENFDGVSTPDIPNCWTAIANSTSIYAVVETSTTNNSAPNSVRLYNSSDLAAELILVSPEIAAADALDDKWVNFYARGGTGYELVVGTMTDPATPATFTAFDTVDVTTTTFQYYQVFFDTYVGADNYIAFKHNLGGTYRTIYIDDIVIDLIPSCFSPTDLTAASITNNAASLSWTENNTIPATLWDIELGVAGFTQTGVPTQAGVSNPYTYGSLLSQTDYEWYVRSDCGGGDYSTWSGPHSFTTACDPITVLPWTEGFEGMAAVGSGIVPDCMASDGGWYSSVDSTSYNRYPRTDSSFMYTNYSADDYLFTPGFNLTAGTAYSFSFWYITDGLSGWTTVEAVYGTEQTAAAMTNVLGTPVSGATNILYEEYSGAFIPATSGTYYFAIHVVASSSPWYMSFDDLTVDLGPACVPPYALNVTGVLSNQVDLGWTQDGGATDWDIEYGESPYTFTGTPTFSTTTNPHTLGSLTAGTMYDWRIRANCGGGIYSDWTSTASFTTAYAAPFCEDFTAGYPALDWAEGTGLPPAAPVFGSSLWLEDGFANNGTTGSAKLNIYSTTRDEWMFTPLFDVGSAGAFELTFDLALTDYANTNPPDSVGDDDKFAVYISTDNFATYTLLQMWDNTTTPKLEDVSSTGETITLPLAYTGVVQIAFYGESTVSNTDNDLFVDNVCVFDPTAPPICTTAIDPLSGALDIGIAGTLTWNTAAGASGYKIYFGTDGGGLFDPSNIEAGTDLGNVTSYDFTGLLFSTVHYWKIVPYNTIGGDAVGCGLFSFTTAAAAVTPATEDFETFTIGADATGYANGWSTSPFATTGEYRWNVDAGGTPSSATGPTVDHTTGTSTGIYLFTESSSGLTGDTAYVYSPWYDLSSLTKPGISFWYHMHGVTMGELHLDVETTTGIDLDVTSAIVGQQQGVQTDAWLERVVNLNAYAGENVRLIFRSVRGTSYTSDMAIDDVVIDEFQAGTIDGTITWDDGTDAILPLENVLVSCAGATTYTNAAGYYSLLDIPVGDKDLTAVKWQYYDYQATVTVTLNTNTTHDITMLYAPNAPTNLGAIPGGDASKALWIDLAWDEPAPMNEISYDDNSVEGFAWVAGPSTLDQYMCVKFNAPLGGTVQDFVILNAADNGLAFQEALVCPDDGSGNPDLLAAWQTFVPGAVNSTISEGGEWTTYSLTAAQTVNFGDAFYFVVRWPAASDDGPFIAYDNTSPNASRSLWTNDAGATWNVSSLGNSFIRTYLTATKGANYTITPLQPTQNTSTLISKSSSPVSVLLPYNNIQGMSFNAPEITIEAETSGKAFLDNYNIYRGTVPGTLAFLTNVAGATTYLDNTVVNGQAYYYAVSALYDEGESVTTDTVYAFAQEPTVLPYASDFEADNGGFNNFTGDWEWGTITTAWGPGTAYSGSNMWATVLDTNYAVNADDLMIQPFDLSAKADYALTFYAWFNLESGYDYVDVGVFDDANGGGFVPLATYNGVAESWTKYWIQIPDSLTSVYTRVGIYFTSDGSVTRAGFYMDDMTVEAYVAPFMTLTPGVFDQTVFVDGLATDNLTIGNTGGFPLDYQANVIYTAAADTSFNESFDTGAIPAGWTTVDNDGDTYDWKAVTTADLYDPHTGDGCMASASWDATAGALTPDNWLISPALTFDPASTQVVLSWWHDAQDELYPDDFYYVKLSTAGTALTDFTTTLWSGFTPTEWEKIAIDITSYKNQTIYIAFQHADCTDWFEMKIDDVIVEELDVPTGWVSIDGGSTTSGLVDLAGEDIIPVDFDATGLVPGDYTAQIEIVTNEPEPVKATSIIDVTMHVIVGFDADITVFLEGPYDAGTGSVMNTDLTVPLVQPYNPPLPYYLNNDPKWLYDGTEFVSAVPAGTVDWVLVQLRDTVDVALAGSDAIIATKPAFLLADGSVVGLDGNRLGFPGVSVTYDLFAVIFHRNHLGIISANALTSAAAVYTYDYTSAATQVYNDTSGCKELEIGIWGMIAADGDGNGNVQPADETNVWAADVNGSGYIGGDYNLNGLGQANDKTNFWVPNTNKSGQVPSAIGVAVEGYKSQIPE